MSASVLVTWATRYGSTEEVAHAVADELLRRRFSVQAQPMASVASLDHYDAVVLGFALYMGHIHKDARRFLTAHQNALSQRPVALFTLGPLETGEKHFAAARLELSKELAKFAWLSPVGSEVFGGKFDPEKLGFPFKLIPALRRTPPTDVRDWTAIHAWAGNLASRLQPAMAR
jgi:menaquinone-dependent protoporphyrinogen oxidase